MKEIGEYLKNRRLELGISLDEAEQYLKIRKKYLVGIEEGNESILPGRTYFIGYLRNYANYLEADQEYVDQLLGETKQGPKTSEQEQEPVETIQKRKRTGKYFSPEKSKYRPKREKRNINYIPFIKIVAIIIVLGGGIFIVNQFLNRTEQPSIPVNNNEENIIESTENEQKTIEQELTEMAEENLQKEEIEESSTGILLEPLPEYKPIKVVAQEPAWVKIMDDDQILFESLILSTEEIIIKSEGMISLLTSSNDDISVFYGDEEIEAQPTDNYRLMSYQIIANNENN